MKGGNEATSGSGITQFANGEQNVGSVQIKMTQPETSPGCSPSSGYNLTACRQEKAEASKNLFRRTTPPPRWIAAVSASEDFNHKEHKEKNRREAFTWNRVAVQYF